MGDKDTPSPLPVQSMSIRLKGLTGTQQYENWKTFKFQFSNYLIATKQSEHPEERKVAMLLHMLGVEVVQIYQSFNKAPKKLDDALKLFEEYFAPKKNTSLARNTFLSRRQMPGESLEAYITSLKNLATPCEFETLSDSLVKDIFILGLLDENAYIRERLLEVGDSKDLTGILDLARTIEMSKEKVNSNVFGVQYPRNRRQGSYQFKKSQNPKCQNCGLNHQPSRCPASRAACNSCSKIGHYAKMCRKKVHVVQEDLEDENSQYRVSNVVENVYNNCKSDNFFIGSISINQVDTGDTPASSMKVNVEINRKVVEMYIDTMADANVISLSVLKSTGLTEHIIRPTQSKLTAYGGASIPILGHCILYCNINNRKLPLRFFICKVDQPSLLSREASEKFNLIRRVNSVSDNSQFGSYAQLVNSYSDLFEGLGCLPGVCKINLKENAIPQVDPPRRIPFKLMDKYKQELDRMCELKVIEKVSEPTEWVNSVVLVEKPDGSLRVCLDPKPLNKAIVCSKYQLPTIEDIRSHLVGSNYFSKLDASTAFWSIVLDEPSSKLCTFGSPFGRFKFLRLPYGVNLASEKFHQIIVEWFSDIQGVLCYIDDILIFGKTKTEHDQILKKVFDRVRKINLKLNKKKCVLGQTKITFLGQIFQSHGMSPDLSKIEAIEKMPEPKNLKDLQRFLGMTNYLSSYLPNMSDKSNNLRKLLRKDSEWSWDLGHQKEFDELKRLICCAPVLGYFDVKKPLVLNVDCSQNAVGAYISHDKNPIAYASKSLTDTQKRWAQIEKELFAIWFGCHKFHQYIYGQSVQVESDHKPLIPLFKKPLSDIPSRLQRIMLKLQLYNLTVTYKAGKEMYVSDTLSRAALQDDCRDFDILLEEELAIHSNMFMRTLEASDEKLKQIKEATENDNILKEVKKFIYSGWPEHKNSVPKHLLSYYPHRNELHCIDEIIFKNNCIVIPKSLQADLLLASHASHMGYQKNKNFVKTVMFWPSLYEDLKILIMNCETCLKFKPNNCKEPLIPHEMPSHPWEKVGVDLFEFNRSHYLIIVDYYSKFFETALLHKSTSSSIISHFKSIFSRQGVPAQIISDRGPPFSSKDLDLFYKEWNIEHKCSSPYYPKSNGLVEQTVKLVKHTLMKCKESNSDPYLAMLHLRNAYSDGQDAPSQLLNARYLRTNLPVCKNQLRTKPVPFSRYKSNNQNRISKMKKSYDKGARTLEPFVLNQNILYQKKPGNNWLPAKVVKLPHQINSKRAYEIQTPDGCTYVRNRVYLRKAGRNMIVDKGPCNLSPVVDNNIMTETDVYNTSCNDTYLDYFYCCNNTVNGEPFASGSVPSSELVSVPTVPNIEEESIIEVSSDSSGSFDLNDTLLGSSLLGSAETSLLDDSVSDPTWKPN